MFKSIKNWFVNLFVQKKETVIETTVVHRISKDTYEKVVKSKLPNSYAGNDTTEVEAAFKLGVAHAKEVFERELVV